MSTTDVLTVPAKLKSQNMLEDDVMFTVVFRKDGDKLDVSLHGPPEHLKANYYIFSGIEMVSFYLLAFRRQYVMSLWYRDKDGDLRTFNHPMLNSTHDSKVSVDDKKLCNPDADTARKFLLFEEKDVPLSLPTIDWKRHDERNGNLVYLRSETIETMLSAVPNPYLVQTGEPRKWWRGKFIFKYIVLEVW